MLLIDSKQSNTSPTLCKSKSKYVAVSTCIHYTVIIVGVNFISICIFHFSILMESDPLHSSPLFARTLVYFLSSINSLSMTQVHSLCTNCGELCTQRPGNNTCEIRLRLVNDCSRSLKSAHDYSLACFLSGLAIKVL